MKLCHTHEWNDIPWIRSYHAYVMRHVDTLCNSRCTSLTTLPLASINIHVTPMNCVESCMWMRHISVCRPFTTLQSHLQQWHRLWLIYTVRDSETQFVTLAHLVTRIHTSWLFHTVRDSDTQFVTLFYTIRDSYTQFVTHTHSSWLRYTWFLAYRLRDSNTQSVTEIHSSWLIYTVRVSYTQLATHTHGS